MSDLLRKMAKPPPSNITTKSTIPEDDVEGDSSSASSVSSVGTLVPSTNAMPSAEASIVWHKFFDQELYLESENITYHAYLIPPKSISSDILFVCQHGVGSSGMSFAPLATEIKSLLPSAGIISIEARGHGSTVTAEDPPDLSLTTLRQDLETAISLTKKKLAWTDLPKLVLVGHSVGGAVVTQLAQTSPYGNKLVGFAVIDVVEGSAVEALKFMQAYLSSRPSSFSSPEEATDWHIRSRTILNSASAEVSTPPLLRKLDSGRWIWRTDLSATKDYWDEWYTGMSSAFLAGKASKLLILAGTDRLDKELMIGQMRGSFQLSIFPEAGHFVQEDVPLKLAELLVEFYKRNDRSALVLPPKVSDLLKQGKNV